jgi:hypothetical protein
LIPNTNFADLQFAWFQRLSTSTILGISSKSSVGVIAKKDRQSRRLADARGNKSTGADKHALPH